MKKTDIHAGWLHLESIMLARHGPERWEQVRQGMQSAFYMGAGTCLQSKNTEDENFTQIETGLQDALRAPNMRLVRV